MWNIQRCAELWTSCNGYYFGRVNTVHYSVHYAAGASFFLFQQSVNAVPQGGSVAAERDFLTCFPVFALDLVVTADSQMLARFFGKLYAKLVKS